MNSRERVLRAFGKIKGLPDRIPVQFDLCRQLSDYFGEKLDIPVHYTENLYEDVTYRISANELRTAMGSAKFAGKNYHYNRCFVSGLIKAAKGIRINCPGFLCQRRDSYFHFLLLAEKLQKKRSSAKSFHSAYHWR
ncbi:MAG: hypothetical protein K0B11_23010 [Mariniphaga sp.]|nr:hypothetical protein [Mariniphaga sp.]